ncbi:hypothetical protein WICPIJ_003590 [Wickerhamomyces pijperi]|uniref:Mitochondrial group I intron splicing factor CCM1 n=1 Tax=Wickerhamomyces pijperi TaxID=599730 RepID=A0A9P8Q7J2_WICPI|nr:hypothetical protein WICPIJ_003590 [Wickerhamomyces pijperi]
MLRLTKLPVSAASSAASCTLRASVSKSTAVKSIRFQTTTTSTATPVSESKSKSKSKSESESASTIRPKLTVREYTAKSLAGVDKLINSKATSLEIFNEFNKVLTAHAENAKSFTEYGSRAFKILLKANEEAHSTDPASIPPSLEEIISLLQKHDMLNYNHVTFVMQQLIKDGEYLGALNQAISFLQILKNRKRKNDSADLTGLTIVSYLLYTKDSAKPSKEQLFKIIGSQTLPEEKLITTTMRRIQLDAKSFDIVRKQYAELLLSDQSPNSIKLIKSALAAAKLGNSSKVDKSLETARKISKINGSKLNEDTVNAYMKMYNLLSRGDDSMKLWNELIESGIKPSANVWNTLLETVSLSGRDRLEKVELVLKEMEAAGVKRNDETDATLIRIYSKFNKAGSIEALLNKRVNKKSTEVAFAHLEWLAQKGEVDQVSQKIMELKKQGMVLPVETFNRLIYNFAVKHKYEAAQSLLKSMDDLRVKPDVTTYAIILDCMLKLYVKVGLTPDSSIITDFIADMKRNNIEVNESTLTSIMTYLSRNPSFKQTAEFWFEYLCSTNKATKASYISAITSQLEAGDIEGAEKYFQQLQDSQFEVDAMTWSLMFRGFYTNRNVAKTMEYLDKLLATGAFNKYFNRHSVYFVLTQAQKLNNKELAEKIFDLIEVQKLQINSPRSVEVMKRLIKDQVIPVSDHVQKLIGKSSN